MNVLEKILEVIKKPENYTIMCGKHVTTVDRVEEIICSHMNEKEKVTSAEIVSREVDGKTYYAIKYKEVGKDYYTVGYGSYKLDYVVCWLNEYFEFCGEAKVVVGVGKDTNIPSNDGWIPVEDGLPEEHDSIFAKFKGTDMWSNAMFEKSSDKVNVTFEFEDGTRKSGTSYTIDGKWKCEKGNCAVKRKVIAWRPLLEPYKPKKDLPVAGNEHIMNRFMKVE